MANLPLHFDDVVAVMFSQIATGTILCVDFHLYTVQVIYKFQCMVRVMATWPSDVVNFCLQEGGDFVYAVQLMLEDPTARLCAHVHGPNAVSRR